jgi:hypothetical protein
MIVDPSSSQTSVAGAIRQAANRTGTNFQYLLATAQVESNLNPGARGVTSSAAGLFQFIDQTWLATLKEHGPALGYGAFADAIARLPSGQYAVSDPSMTESVMNLRSDPAANAAMAGAFTRSNAAALSARLGREATEGELYIAHFFGSGGAGKLIGLAEAQPATPAAQVFPGAARANPAIFFDRQGQARTVSDVYRVLVGRYQAARNGPINAAMAASADLAARPVPDPAGTVATFEGATRQTVRSADDGPVFHSLFQTGERREAVAPMVSSLWTAPSANSAAGPSEVRGGTLGLFQDAAPDGRALFAGRG